MTPVTDELAGAASLALVVVAHPDPASLTHAAAHRAVEGLRAAGHEVELIDLYGLGFRAAMSAEERAAYSSESPIIDPMVHAHADLVRRARQLVVVYPTWWSGPPAVLKGWLERVLVTGVAFRLHPRTKRVTPAMQHIERIVGISTYGSPWLYVRLVNDNGRRILTRSLRIVCGARTATTWLALYSVDTADERRRGEFLDRIQHTLARPHRRARRPGGDR